MDAAVAGEGSDHSVFAIVQDNHLCVLSLHFLERAVPFQMPGAKLLFDKKRRSLEIRRYDDRRSADRPEAGEIIRAIDFHFVGSWGLGRGRFSTKTGVVKLATGDYFLGAVELGVLGPPLVRGPSPRGITLHCVMDMYNLGAKSADLAITKS